MCDQNKPVTPATNTPTSTPTSQPATGCCCGSSTPANAPANTPNAPAPKARRGKNAKKS